MNKNKIIDKFALTNDDFLIIQNGQRLKDSHINRFHDMMSKNSSYKPLDVLLLKKFLNNKDNSQYVYKYPILRDKPHIQILHSCDGICPDCVQGHWICTYFDMSNIWILDPLNLNSLHFHHKVYLRAVYPYINEIPIKFLKVQDQTNAVDCGVLSIAYATSLYFGKNPAYITYKYDELGKHLYNMFKTNILSHFPMTVPHEIPVPASINNETSMNKNKLQYPSAKFNNDPTINAPND